MTDKNRCAICKAPASKENKLYDDICLRCHERKDFQSENGHGFHTPRGDWPDRPTINGGY